MEIYVEELLGDLMTNQWVGIVDDDDGNQWDTSPETDPRMVVVAGTDAIALPQTGSDCISFINYVEYICH